MAYFEIYAAKGSRRKWQLYAEVSGAMSGVWLFWRHIEDKYLPKIYSPLKPDVKLSRLFVDGGTKAKEIWNLWKDKSNTLYLVEVRGLMMSFRNGFRTIRTSISTIVGGI